MDAVGAMLGPLVAFCIIYAIPNGFDVVFLTSLCLAVIGVAVLVTFVTPHVRPSPSAPAGAASPTAITAATVLDLLRAPAFRHLAIAAFLFGGLTISDGFVYLTLQQRSPLTTGAFPLLYVATSAAYLLFAVPLGRAADRIGRFPVFVAGHVLLLFLYGSLAGQSGGWLLILFVPLLLGLYYAATEGVLMALGSALLPEALRTSGLALLTTTLAIGRFAGSGIFGLGWSQFGLRSVTIGYMLALAVAIGVVIVLRPRLEHA